MVLDLNKEMAWVTFMDNGFETIWHPVTDITGKQLMWSEDIMDHCRAQFNDSNNWISFGIAPTSQILVKNSVRDNL
tara:strand:+ start:49 stop:276 length:228 start_codon:yes stop_codon:yes gene_type:complete